MNMLKSRLKDFKLSGIYNTLDDRLALVKDKSLSYQEFLELLLEDEENNRRENSYKKRYSKAKLPYEKRIEDFDFTFQPDIDRIVHHSTVIKVNFRSHRTKNIKKERGKKM